MSKKVKRTLLAIAALAALALGGAALANATSGSGDQTANERSEPAEAPAGGAKEQNGADSDNGQKEGSDAVDSNRETGRAGSDPADSNRETGRAGSDPADSNRESGKDGEDPNG
jgi:hypothetical protein